VRGMQSILEVSPNQEIKFEREYCRHTLPRDRAVLQGKGRDASLSWSGSFPPPRAKKLIGLLLN
jgi:hypothetical protein